MLRPLRLQEIPRTPSSSSVRVEARRELVVPDQKQIKLQIADVRLQISR
jgi:hypothetical protein